MKNKPWYTNSIILGVCSFAVLAITVLFFIYSLGVTPKETNAKPVDINLKTNKNPINIEEILKENTAEKISEELVLEQIDIEYTTEYRNNSDIPKGTIQVLQEGRDGRQDAIIIKKYKDEELISEELVSENIIKAPVNRIVEIGTGSGTNNYKPKARRHGICDFKSFSSKA